MIESNARVSVISTNTKRVNHIKERFAAAMRLTSEGLSALPCAFTGCPDHVPTLQFTSKPVVAIIVIIIIINIIISFIGTYS
jgi:hypothetical protein